MKEKYRFDNIKFVKNFVIMISWIALAFIVFSCNHSSVQNTNALKKDSMHLDYYCPMHPQIVQDRMGKCPIKECNGMDLVLKMPDSQFKDVINPVNEQVLSSIKTINPSYIKKPLNFLANGVIGHDTRTERNISSLVSGRIEKLYIKFPFQPVHRGERLLEIYSPELVTAQENYLYIFTNDSAEHSLIEAAREKLRLLGFTNQMFNDIQSKGSSFHAVIIYSPFDGLSHVMKSMSASVNMENNTSLTHSQFTRNELSIKEGDYVMMGETLFNIVNPKKVNAVIQIKADDLSKIRIGSPVTVLINDDSIDGRVDFIEPVLESDSRFVRVRVYLDNPHYELKVGTVISAVVSGPELQTLWVPLTSIIDLGTRKVVLLRIGNSFKTKGVETGAISDNMIEVSDGLTEEDEIASEAHYLIDSEGFIRTKKND